MRLVANRQVSGRVGSVFKIFLQPNGCSDRIEIKRLKIAVFKNYRLIDLEMKLL
jgi:hypothetical protein